MANAQLNDPFGIPDGGIGDIDRFESDFVDMPDYHGGIARELDDASVRVVAGRLGAGKSLYLRMMRKKQLENPSVYAEPPARNLAELSTSDVVAFARRSGSDGTSVEAWKTLWRRAIFRSAASFVLSQKIITSAAKDGLVDEVRSYRRLLGNPARPRRVTTEAKNIITEHASKVELRNYLNDGQWSDAEGVVLDALFNGKPLFLYVDAIDDSFRHAPMPWMRCQRGLFYAIMDLLREGEGANRLHVIIALRDIVLGSVRASEHAPRYLEQTHINVLGWNTQSILEFLRYKVERLPDQFFSDPTNKSVSSWLGRREIVNGRANRSEEAIEDYLIRHTRIVPRDIVVLGNRLCRYVLAQRARNVPIDDSDLRRVVSLAARDFAESQLAQCANQAMSDAMPDDAVDHRYEHVFLEPNEYQINDAVGQISECIAAVGVEEFDSDVVAMLDEMASESFGEKMNLGHILWQNGLVGWARDDLVHYFSLDDLASPSLPKAERYVFNPILFDRIDQLRSTLPAPLTPAS